MYDAKLDAEQKVHQAASKINTMGCLYQEVE